MAIGFLKNRTISHLRNNLLLLDTQSENSSSAASRTEPDELLLGQECFNELGVFPISFSWPGPVRVGEGARKRALAPIIPGQPYSFFDYQAYLRCYQQSEFAITFKKVGWDCFRHLEILFSGSIPLMPDVSLIPEYTMIHYPKALMVGALQDSRNGQPASGVLSEELRKWCSQHLTSESMSNYFLALAGADTRSVLFVDRQLPNQCDYLSVMTLIGLKQLLGSSVHVQFPVSYVYDNAVGDFSSMYGRGFGYTRILSSEQMTTAERLSTEDNEIDISAEALLQYSTIVVGDMHANMDFIAKVESLDLDATLIYMRGGDLAPTRSEYREIRKFKGFVFSREIY
jgi:hypothetical protein